MRDEAKETYTGVRNSKIGALVVHDLRDLESLLRFSGSFDEDHAESRLHVLVRTIIQDELPVFRFNQEGITYPLNMAMD